LDKRVRSEVESLLRQPNETGESYGALKELMIEDYYVVGHGCFELNLRTDLIPRSIETVDPARIAFNKKWDGRDRTVPRYLKLDDSFAKAERWYASEELMCLVNRPMSYTRLGFSHVEALHKTVLALLSGDEFMIRQILQPVSEKLISLGEGVTAQQVTDFKYQINQVRDKIAVVGGSKDPRVLNLSGTAEELKILDGCEWFVRQVAAVFNISTAKLKLAVDTSRANTEAMMADDLEAIEGDLTRIIELENSVFIDRYRYLGEVNLTFSYPIMHRKDERQQAAIASRQIGNQPWASINEARVRTGEKPLDPAKFPFADEPLINTKDGPVPMSIWQDRVAADKAD